MQRAVALTVCISSLFCLSIEADQAAPVIVSTTNDTVNGDVTSVASLRSNPGPDGTSLREAMLAVNNSRIPARIEMDRSLAGQTITLSGPLPPIRVDDTIIVGPPAGSGIATLDLSQVSGSNCTSLIIAASGVTIARLRFTDVTPNARALQVYAGVVANDTCSPMTAPPRIRNILIVDCELDNSPRETTAYAISIGTDPGGRGNVVSNVRLIRNRFIHFRGDGTTVHLQLGGESNSIEGVTIEDNDFIECMFAVELVNCCGGQVGNRISNVAVVRNRFERGGNVAIVLGTIGVPGAPVARLNRIDGTVIARNMILRQSHWGIILNGGFNNAVENEIAGVEITNNLIAHAVSQDSGAILAIGGDVGGTSNRTSNIRITNNTIAFNEGAGLAVADNPGGSANRVEDLLVRNTIFWQNGADLGDGVALAEVESSITTHPDFTGHNGNFAANPDFVDPSGDDFQLGPGSPAIDRGTPTGAPSDDLRCGLRTGAVDLGANEYGAAPGVGLLAPIGGSGTGAVQLLPVGRPCGDHLRVFALGTTLTITPIAGSGSRFQDWLGDEGCVSGSLAMDREQLCAALFRIVARRRAVRR